MKASHLTYTVLLVYSKLYKNRNETILLVIFLTEIPGEETGVQDLLMKFEEKL